MNQAENIKTEGNKSELSMLRKEIHEIKIILLYLTVIFCVTVLSLLTVFLFILIKFQ